MPFFLDTRRPFKGWAFTSDFSAALANSDFLLRRRLRKAGSEAFSLARYGRLLCSKIIRETETIASVSLHSFVPFCRSFLRLGGYDAAGFLGSLDNLSYILMI